jgi:plasmid stabilization system protein ParE
MAYEVAFADDVRDEYESIVSHLLHVAQAPSAAREFQERSFEMLGVLESLPESFPHSSDNLLRHRRFRRAMAGDYVILYRVDEHCAVIEDGEVLDHGTICGREGLVQIYHIFHASEGYPSLV